MGKTYVLDRVAADLARGLTHAAIQRLSSLVAAYPTDLDLRRRLAAVHRRVGNTVQAGRWDYLTIGANATDTSAFERAFPSAAARLREVRWPHRANAAATSYARSRLTRLVAAAQAEQPPARSSPDGPSPHHVPPARTTGGRALAGATRVELAWPLSSRLLTRMRSWSPPAVLLFAVAIVATAALVVVGTATVVDWIVS
jgi:hypothetical protein